MGKRIMVAVIFIPLLLVLFYLISPAYPWALCLLIAGLSMIAVHEVLWSTGFLKHTRISGYSIILAGLIPFCPPFRADFERENTKALRFRLCRKEQDPGA